MHPRSVCNIVMFLWSALVMAATFYVVFVLDRSGWWFALALLLCSGECNSKEEEN